MASTYSDEATDADPSTRDNREGLIRAEAIKQLERKRHFRIQLVVAALGMILLMVIWATSEYHNAGGWPTQGFSQSSGIHDVWNYWIIYPIIGLGLIMAARAWLVYGRKPITESEIQREMGRQTTGH